MLLQASDSTLLIVDMQGRLMPVIHDGDAVVAANAKLARARGCWMSPWSPPSITARCWASRWRRSPNWCSPLSRRCTFRPRANTASMPAAGGAKTVLVTGCEAHICVLQTVIGLTELGYKAVLVADAAGSRKSSDHHAALRRARAHGAEIVTTEMAIFEWMETCEHPRFRDVLRLVK